MLSCMLHTSPDQVGNHVELAMEWLITHPAEDAPEAPPEPPGSSTATQALAHALAQAPAAVVPPDDAGAVQDEQVAAAMTAAPAGNADSADSAEVAERAALAGTQADRVLQHALPLLAKVRRMCCYHDLATRHPCRFPAVRLRWPIW